MSTTSFAPHSRATAATLAMSVTSRRGLAGVSANSTRVFGRTAARQAPRSGPSTKVTSTPKRGAHWLRIQRQEPNRARPATTWSPARRRPVSATCTAAMPEEVVRQNSAPSSSASRSSNIWTVGLA